MTSTQPKSDPKEEEKGASGGQPLLEGPAQVKSQELANPSRLSSTTKIDENTVPFSSESSSTTQSPPEDPLQSQSPHPPPLDQSSPPPQTAPTHHKTLSHSKMSPEDDLCLHEHKTTLLTRTVDYPPATGTAREGHSLELKAQQKGSKIWRSMSDVRRKTISTIFFKVKDVVRKSAFFGETMEELLKAFQAKFPSITEIEEASFYIKDEHSEVWYELEDVADIYNHAVLDWRERKVQSEEPTDPTQLNRKMVIAAFERHKTCFVMVGLPARGKSYFALKLTSYLTWHSVRCKVFNVGNYRRKIYGAQQDYTFFDPDNTEAARARLHLAISCLDDMLEWLENSPAPVVSIYDATNITHTRRNMLLQRCRQDNVRVIFVETVCNDEEILEKNIKSTKLFSPDYKDFSDPEKAVQDFQNRIKQYEKVYEPCDEQDGSFIRITDIGKSVVVHNITAYLPSRVVYFLMNLHNLPRSIWFSLPGETTEEHRLGSEGFLTRQGENYAIALGDWFEVHSPENDVLSVWTGTSPCLTSSAMYINYPKMPLRVLEDLDVGTFAGMTVQEWHTTPEYKEQQKYPLTYRYGRGENYIDVMHRIEPLLFELERTRNSVLVIAPLAVLRCLFCYFLGQSLDTIPKIDVRRHALYELVPRSYLPEFKIHPFEELTNLTKL